MVAVMGQGRRYMSAICFDEVVMLSAGTNSYDWESVFCVSGLRRPNINIRNETGQKCPKLMTFHEPS